MRKLKALLAVLFIVFASCAVMACDFEDDESSKTEIGAPIINSKVYNGEKQAATVEANDAYVVIKNNGGVNAGEYDVVLKLTDENAYEWQTPDEADVTMITLKFVITKAANSVSGLAIDGWRAGEPANVPTADAEFGEVKYAYATEQNGTYTDTVPTAAGTYFVKAYVEATENYDGAEDVISFVITKPKEENTVTVTAEDIKYGENVKPVVTADATHVPEGTEIVCTYALTSDGEYIAWDTIEKRAGKYFVKATIAEDDDYKGAFDIAEFEMTKGDNEIKDFVIENAKCKQTIILNATATAGTAITYKYATAADGEYIDIPADGLIAGTYYVKAYTAGDNNYVAAESNPATLTVNHAYEWTCDANGNDYRVCACGATEKFVFETSVDVLKKTENGYSLKLYSSADEGKPNKVTFSFKVMLGTTVTDKAVIDWKQSTKGVVEITGSAEYTVKALALGKTVLTATYTDADGKKAHETIDVTVEKLIKTVEVKHETVLADLATTEIDLSFANNYYTENASLVYGDKVLGNSTLSDGKLTVDLSGITETGKLTFVATTDKDGVYYSFDVNVLFATKIIRNVEDMVAVRITADQLGAYTPVEGYYVLGKDIDFANAQIHSDYENVLKNLNNRYWNQNQGFRGTFDGLNHKITNVKIGQGGLFGFVGQDAVIENVDFENVSYIGAYCGSLFGYSVINATVRNVNIGVSAYKNASGNPETQGFLSAKFTAGCKLTKVAIDANAYDVCSLFGKEVKSGTYADVEIKVKSYRMFGNNGDSVNAEDKTIVPDGITVYTSKTVELAHETILLETTTTEIDLSFASAYIGDTVSLTYNGVVLGEGALTDGKLTVDLSGITETGELVFVGSSSLNNTTYIFNVNVLLATKIIRNEDDLNVIRVTQENINNNTSIFGYYVLANDISLSWKTLPETSLTYTEAVHSYKADFGFRGTFDGRGHTISRFAVTRNGIFGHVGKGAVIKNVNFDRLTYNKSWYATLFGFTVRGAEISNVNISLAGYNLDESAKHTQGFLAARYMQDNKLTNVKIDASEFGVYTVFGQTVSNNTCSGVEIKVKSYTTLGFTNDTVSDATMIHKMDGVTVITADTTAEA